MDSSKVRDRGIMPRYVRLWLLERFGEEGITRVLARLAPEAAEMFSHPVPHEWYPVSLMKELLGAVDAEFSTAHPDALRSLGSFVADHSVRGFLKYLARLVSMQKALARVGLIWRRYHDGGSVETSILKKDDARVEGILTIKDYDAGPVWCKLMDAYLETFAASTGAKNVKVEKKDCIHKGDADCSWHISWDP
jgi:hypothetical protein